MKACVKVKHVGRLLDRVKAFPYNSHHGDLKMFAEYKHDS